MVGLITAALHSSSPPLGFLHRPATETLRPRYPLAL